MSRFSPAKLLSCVVCLAVLFPALALGGESASAGGGTRDLSNQFDYRSIAFQGQMRKERITSGDVVHPAVLREIADLGFNDVCFHVERGPQTKQITSMHEGLVEAGIIDLIEELGLTTSVWVHEFMQYDESWGEPAPDNEKLWKALRKRYESYLDLWPQIDYFVVTCTETDMSPKGREIFRKIYETIGGVIRERGGTIIVRSFFHGPHRVWREDMSPVIPDYACVQHKYVQGDWSLRRPSNPLIGIPDPHPMVVEFDVGGEYYETDHILNCFADELAERMENYIIPAGVDGISVRINRHGGTAFDHPNAVNYWYLGLLTSGRVQNVDQAWKKFATEYFDEDVADEIIAVLRPTGDVTAEALSYARASYGNSRLQTVGDRWGFVNRGERFEKPLFLPPYNSYPRGSAKREEYREDFEEQMRGNLNWITKDYGGYQQQLKNVDYCIVRLEGLKDRLDDNTYKYLHWLLEETRWNLITLQEAQQAHFKVFRIVHGAKEALAQQLHKEVEKHLQKVTRQNAIATQTERIRGTWRGPEYSERRGGYVMSALFLVEFRLWMHYLGLTGPIAYDRDGDGKEEPVTTFKELEGYMVATGWEEDDAHRRLGYIKRKYSSFDEYVEGLFGEGTLPRKTPPQ